jgi:hypothetical protein
MTPDQAQNTQDGLLPEPDTSETLRVMMHGSKSGMPLWRLLLPPSLVSFGLHLFLLPFLLVITVTFADSIVGISSWTTNVNADQFGNEAIIEPDWDQEKDVPSGEERMVAEGTDKQDLVALTKQTKPKNGIPVRTMEERAKEVLDSKLDAREKEKQLQGLVRAGMTLEQFHKIIGIPQIIGGTLHWSTEFYLHYHLSITIDYYGNLSIHIW